MTEADKSRPLLRDSEEVQADSQEQYPDLSPQELPGVGIKWVAEPGDPPNIIRGEN